MKNDGIVLEGKGAVIDLSDADYEVLSTTADGPLESVREIRINHYEPDYSNGVLNLHIEGCVESISTKVSEFNVTKVKSVAFANFNGGIERAGQDPQEGDGEVLVVMIIDADIPVSTMARACISVTEGITSAIQDLGLRYDNKCASGSKIENVVIVRRKGQGPYLRGAGNHCKLGELIGKTTIESVKESALKNGLDTKISAVDSAVDHIKDCIGWGLIPEEVGVKAIKGITDACLRH